MINTVQLENQMMLKESYHKSLKLSLTLHGNNFGIYNLIIRIKDVRLTFVMIKKIKRCEQNARLFRKKGSL